MPSGAFLLFPSVPQNQGTAHAALKNCRKDYSRLPPAAPGSEARFQKNIPEGGGVENKAESAPRQSGLGMVFESGHLPGGLIPWKTHTQKHLNEPIQGLSLNDRLFSRYIFISYHFSCICISATWNN